MNTPEHRAGREGYHDPTAGLGGAAPARSALTLRIVLASSGALLCLIGAVVATVLGQIVIACAFGVLVVVGLVDIVVVAMRKRHGEPG